MKVIVDQHQVRPACEGMLFMLQHLVMLLCNSVEPYLPATLQVNLGPCTDSHSIFLEVHDMYAEMLHTPRANTQNGRKKIGR